MSIFGMGIMSFLFLFNASISMFWMLACLKKELNFCLIWSKISSRDMTLILPFCSSTSQQSL